MANRFYGSGGLPVFTSRQLEMFNLGWSGHVCDRNSQQQFYLERYSDMSGSLRVNFPFGRSIEADYQPCKMTLTQAPDLN
jgi:hypothetical protein